MIAFHNPFLLRKFAFKKPIGKLHFFLEKERKGINQYESIVATKSTSTVGINGLKGLKALNQSTRAK